MTPRRDVEGLANRQTPGTVRVGAHGLAADDRAGVARVLGVGALRAVMHDAADLDALRALVAESRVDLVVCGHHPPDRDAVLAVNAVRQLTSVIPVVVLARDGDEDAAVAVIAAGAADYIPRPGDDEELRRALVDAMAGPRAIPLRGPTARFSHLLDQLDIGTFRMLPDHRMVEANDATRRIFGFPTLAALLEPRDPSTYLESDIRDHWTRRISEDGVVRRRTQRVWRADGTPIVVEGDARAVLDERGRMVGIDGYLRDVTESVAATERLEFQALLLEHVRHVVVAAGLDFKVSYWNPYAERLLQRTAADVAGGSVAAALGVSDPEETDRMVDATLRSEGFWDGVIQAHAQDGTPVALHVTSSRLEAGGQHVGYLGTMIDITERQRLEHELEAAVAVRERLLHDVQHRVRRNLQMVSRLLRLQQAQTDDPALRDLFRDSEQRLRAIALIHDWLSPSPDHVRVNVSDYLAHLVDGLRATSGLQDVTRVVADVDPLSLDIDTAVRVGLIVNELVTNALKHAFVPGRAGAVSVTLRCCAPHGMTLVVEDDGVGLPADLDVTATPTLGLQLVRNLAAGLNASLHIERHPGTRVRIEFPPPCADRA